MTEKMSNSDKERTGMAVARTVMAADRSLMAWVRTGLSLISFGFTIYKFLEYSQEQLEILGKRLPNLSSPKVIGVFMVGMGILSIIFGIMQNRTTMSDLKKQHDIVHSKYALLISGILTVLGFVVFLMMLL